MPSRSVDPLTLFFFLSVFKTARSDSHTQWTQRLLCFSTQSSVSGRPRRTLNVHPSPLQTQSPPRGAETQTGWGVREGGGGSGEGGLSAELACLQGSADAAVASAAPLTINTFPVHHHHPPPHQQHDNSSSHQCIALQPDMRRRHNTCD